MSTLAQLKQRLAEHAFTKPRKPRLVKLIFSDPSPSAIKQSLHEGWPNIAIVTDEGTGILTGQALVDLSLPNSLWSSSRLSVERSRNSFVVDDPSLTLAIQTQRGPFDRYLEKHGEEARDTGFFARMLFCCPQSTQGTRFISNPVFFWEHLPKFNTRIRELLERGIGPDGEPTRKIILSFSPEAQARWITAYNLIEVDLNPGRYYCNTKDHASKIADNLARMAADFHLLESRDGQISLDTLERAISVMLWYTQEYVRLFSPPPQIPQEQLDANRLEIWMAQRVQRMGALVNIKRNYILQNAPTELRRKGRLDDALDVLFAQGKIGFFTKGKTSWIELRAEYFTPQQVANLCAQGARG